MSALARGMTDREPDVSVLIVNYNGLQFMEACLDSVAKAFLKFRHEVIVIDNDSSDGSQAYLRARGDIRYIESAENLGFTGGNNRAAREARGRILLLLNNDTCVHGVLDPLVDSVSDPAVGVAGCRLVYGDGRQQFSVGLRHSPARIVLSWLGLEKRHWLPSVFRRLETDRTFYDTSHSEVDWVSGACFATPRALWERLGGFDETFFMYCEDVDYCFRVVEEGLRVSYRADVRVTHFEGAGRPWIGHPALQRTVRSYLHLVGKHAGRPTTRLMSLGLGMVFAMRAFAFGARAHLSVGQSDQGVNRDKGAGYLKVGRALFSHALLGRAIE